MVRCHSLPGFGQRRLALDIGNGVPQRGKALLAVLGLHDAMSYVNKTGTFRLRIFQESSPFCACRVWRDCINLVKTA